MNIIDIAEKQARIHNLDSIDEIEIEVGIMSGVEADILKSVLEIATRDTILENAKAVFVEIQGQARCLDCLNVFPADNFFIQCPVCKQYKSQIIQGEELRVKSLNVY